MTDALDLTAEAAVLAEAAARMSRLLPARSLQPELAGVLLRAEGSGLVLTATDGELSAEASLPATVHSAADVVVSRRGLAETLATLDAFTVRLVVEGSRVAVRTPGARFALPRLDVTGTPRPAEFPPALGTVDGALLRSAAVPVGGAASREHALPIFTGVRLRSSGDRLTLAATDRFRMAVASVPWHPAPAGSVGAGRSERGAEVDALVSGALLAEVARQAGRAEAVVVHADGDRFGLAWPGGSVLAASLGDPFPDRQIDRLLDIVAECVVEVDADELAAAVHRAVPYSGQHGRLAIDIGDGVVIVRGSDPLAGESEETVKATVRGNQLTGHYQARFLLDALRPFGADTVTMRVQSGLRATEFSADDRPDGLRYLVVPMRGLDA